MQPLELMMHRSSTDEMLGDPSETANVEVEAGQTLDFDDPYSRDPNEVELAVKKGSEGWKLRVSALALGCMAMIGALFEFAHAPPSNEFSSRGLCSRSGRRGAVSVKHIRWNAGGGVGKYAVRGRADCGRSPYGVTIS